MKRFVLIAALIAAPEVDAQTWQWGQGYSNAGNTVGSSIGQDKAGNLYVPARCTEYIGHGGAFEQLPLLYKLNSSGTVIRKDTLPYMPSVSVTDSIGNTYILAQYSNIFFKADQAGTVLFTVAAPTIGRIQDIDLHPGGGVVVCGYYNEGDSIGGNIHSYVGRFDANGNLVWKRKADFLAFQHVSVHQNGNIYLIGEGAPPSGSPPNTPSPLSLMGLSSNGSELSRTALQEQFVSDFLISPDQTIYLLSIAGNANNVYTVSLSSFDLQFSKKWTQSAIGSELRNNLITCDPFGNVILTGGFDQSITAGNTVLTGSYQTYVLSYNSLGSLQWALASAGPGGNLPYAIMCNGQDNIYLAGGFGGDQNFGSSQFTEASSYGDMFVASAHYTIMSTSVSKVAANSQVNVFPNPSAGLFSVNGFSSTNSSFEINVYNTLGSLILHQTANGATQIDLRIFPPGVYYAKFEGTGINETRRLIIK